MERASQKPDQRTGIARTECTLIRRQIPKAVAIHPILAQDSHGLKGKDPLML